MNNPRYKNGFQLTLHSDLIDAPLKWRKARLIFVNSMSDLFHKDVPFSFIKQIFHTMEKAHWHTFQIVTKRSKRLLELSDRLDWPSNVWMGVTVESHRHIKRINDLSNVPSKVKFLSMEPLLSDFPELPIDEIDWVIVGGESGPRSRIMQSNWVRNIREHCLSRTTPFFFKQWGGVNKKRNGRVLDGRTWDDMPELPSKSNSLIDAFCH
jgi:protein gp37